MPPRLEAILRSVLVASPDVAALVGPRIYWKTPPREPTFPAVVYQTISRTQDGTTGIARQRIQYSCMARSALEAATLADAVRCALHGYRAVRDAARIEDVRYAGQTEDYDPETGMHWIPVDIIVTFLEM